MKKILFSIPAWSYGLGPLGQCLCVGKYARQDGHTCQFVAHSTAEKHILDAGFELLTTEDETEWSSLEGYPAYFSGFLEKAGLASVKRLTGLVEDSLSLLQRSQPEVVFSVWHVPMQIAAMRLNIPVVNSTLFPDHPSFIAKEADAPQSAGAVEKCLNTVMGKFGLPSVEFASDLIFHFSTPVCAIPHWIDGSFLSRGIEVHDVATLCYDFGASISNSAGNAAVYLPGISHVTSSLVCKALTDMGLSPAVTGSVGGDMVSFERLLRGADVTVAHGGVNTILMSLEQGTPVVALPLGDGERCHFVGQAEQLGCVFQAEDDEVSLQNAIRAALSGESKEALASVQERIRSTNGPAAVVRLFHALCHR